MDASALIDKLQEIAEGDVGYLPTQTGSGFLPLGTSEAGTLFLGQKPPASSNTMRELVKLGAVAVPTLIEHLDDQRPTKITIGHDGGFGGIFFQDEYDYNSRAVKQQPAGVNRRGMDGRNPKKHTVTVGDLCFVALGQIVNRHFNAVRYQPTACIMINSPTSSEKLRMAIKKEWGNLTPERHKESLVRDFLEPDYEPRRTGAGLRLGYYYPEAFEPLVLNQLAEPRYDVFAVQDLIRQKLYRTQNAKKRKSLVEAFVAKHGEVARQGIQLYLFEDLDRQQKDPAGACLTELFGYPNDVTKTDRPQLFPVENCAQARFIDSLVSFPSEKIDEAIRTVLHSTDERYLARACADYLVGRGADADIRQYVEQRRKGADEVQKKELERLWDRLGWTPLHAAAGKYEMGRIEGLILKGADVNARATNGQTPLHVAADHGSYGAIRALLERKADPNLKDKKDQTPVQLGIGYESAVEMLLAGGAEPSDILVASFAGRADLVERYLEEDKTLVGARTYGGETPLHFATLRDHVEVAKVLLAHGADVNAVDSKTSKLTPLHRAATYSGREMVELLLAHNADRNAKSWDGQTPLKHARDHKDKDVGRLLRQKQ